jgi:hypothetical protein
MRRGTTRPADKINTAGRDCMGNTRSRGAGVAEDGRRLPATTGIAAAVFVALDGVPRPVAADEPEPSAGALHATANHLPWHATLYVTNLFDKEEILDPPGLPVLSRSGRAALRARRGARSHAGTDTACARRVSISGCRCRR